jgi:hypothetical protein
MGLILAACGGAAQTAVPTATTAVIAPTTTPNPTTIPTPALPKMVEYKHPSNSFSISVPADWTKSENSGYVLFSSPDQKAAVELLAGNTINTLDADTFTKTINSFEFNVFSPNKNYKETKRDVQADKGYAVISKTLDVNTAPIQIATIYELKGKVMYIESYYSAVSAVNSSGPIFTALDNSFKSDPAYAEDLPPFTSAVIVYTEPNNFYSLGVPSLWTYDDPNKNGSVITYTSPDTNGIIMLVEIDFKKTVTRTIADTRALEMLKSMYNDVRISKTEVLKNGSIQMTWAPKSGGVVGLSIYKWNGTVWYMMTWMANVGFEVLYGPVFNQSMASYQIPG